MISDLELLNRLKELECNFLLNEIRSDPQKLAELIADEFFDFGSSGTIWTK